MSGDASQAVYPSVCQQRNTPKRRSTAWVRILTAVARSLRWYKDRGWSRAGRGRQGTSAYLQERSLNRGPDRQCIRCSLHRSLCCAVPAHRCLRQGCPSPAGGTDRPALRQGCKQRLYLQRFHQAQTRHSCHEPQVAGKPCISTVYVWSVSGRDAFGSQSAISLSGPTLSPFRSTAKSGTATSRLVAGLLG